MGWSKHSIPTELSVIKKRLTFRRGLRRGKEVRCGDEGAIHVCNNCMLVHCETKDGLINYNLLWSEMGRAGPLFQNETHSISSEMQALATEIYQTAISNHEMKNRRMDSSPIQMCWVFRLGYFRFFSCLSAAFELDSQIQCYSWNGGESVVEHIISSNYNLTQRFLIFWPFLHIIRAILSSKERFIITQLISASIRRG